MSNYKQLIKNYGLDVNDTEYSPFESLRMLHDRSKIREIENKLDTEEKLLLYTYDLTLIKNAKSKVEHMSKVYDFSPSDEPISEWWWHLGKVASGEITFNLCPTMTGQGKTKRAQKIKGSFNKAVTANDKALERLSKTNGDRDNG